MHDKVEWFMCKSLSWYLASASSQHPLAVYVWSPQQCYAVCTSTTISPLLMSLVSGKPTQHYVRIVLRRRGLRHIGDAGKTC